jgi:aryl-alcohol dehydrogenase-like predicted oxidoreductase
MSTVDQNSKLAIGTVQFGLPYGIANRNGQVSKAEVELILAEARRSGINTLDTAIAYGTSEDVLGSIPLDGFDIVTKLPAVPDDCKDVAGWVATELEASLSRLKVSKIDSLLLHRPEQLMASYGDVLYSALTGLREEGVVRRIGVSIYSPDDLDAICQDKPLDLVQAPFNIMDTRLLDSGLLHRLESSGTKLHVRSIFMQGLLLMPMGLRPEKFNRWASHWINWERWLEQNDLTPLEACLRYALSIPQIERVIVGVDSATQLKDILKGAVGECPLPPAGLSCSDIELLNPSFWNKL